MVRERVYYLLGLCFLLCLETCCGGFATYPSFSSFEGFCCCIQQWLMRSNWFYTQSAQPLCNFSLPLPFVCPRPKGIISMIAFNASLFFFIFLSFSFLFLYLYLERFQQSLLFFYLYTVHDKEKKPITILKVSWLLLVRKRNTRIMSCEYYYYYYQYIIIIGASTNPLGG